MKNIGRLFRALGMVFLVVAILDQVRRPADERTWTGNVLFVPYDFRLPTLDRIRSRLWNSDDDRILMPHVWGVGWTVNLYQVQRQLRSLIG